jgi:hypothetical protein
MAPRKLDPRLAAAFLLATLSATCDKAEVQGTPGAGGSAGQGGPGPSNPPPEMPPPFNPMPGPGTGAGPAPGPATGTGDVGKECAREIQQADKVPLDLLVLMDNSFSMSSGAGPMRTRWEASQLALSSFVRDPGSAGLGVGLQFFPARPSKLCSSDQDCPPGEPCLSATACPGSSMTSPGKSCNTLNLIGTPVTCSAGVSCVAVGTCSTSGALCTGVGQRCPAAAGTCEPFPKVCVSQDVPGGGACMPATYETPATPIEELPGARPRFLATLLSRFPVGATPMQPAVQGAIDHLEKHLLANPGRKGALVLVSDGVPGEGCNGGNSIPGVAAELAAAFQRNPSIRTYVIGVFAARDVPMAQMTLGQLASAGGTNTAIVVDADADLPQRLLGALGEVRKAALSCEYKIPSPTGGAIDFSKVNLRYTDAGSSELLPYVESADRCDPVRGGWYYDVPPARGTPTRVITCDASCGRFKASKTGKVDLVFGCVTIIE